MNKNNKTYLSVVATSRNDDHGGDPLTRTQIFIDCLAKQCERYHLNAELIVVDWNPVSDRPGLAAVLTVPSDMKYFSAQIITVPTVLHARIKYSEKLPLFQMIAKNVGIRRAKGKFVLATNIDIVFSDELMQYISLLKLDPSRQYRVDRYDIKSGLTKDMSLEQTLEYAWANPIRTNRRYRPSQLVKHIYGDELFRRYCEPAPEFRGQLDGVNVIQEDGVWQIHPERSVTMRHLHTNACGDFTLISKEGWEAIRGYPEFAAYSFNIDSMGVIAAHYAGYTEVALLPPCVCFHIEHSVGSGWTPEGEIKLFERLRQAEILNPEWPVLTPLVDQMRENKQALEFNHAGWGLADFELPEQHMGDTSPVSQERLLELSEKASMCSVTAIQPMFDLDRLTLAHEFREKAKIKLPNTQKAHIFVPDANGEYTNEYSTSRDLELHKRVKLVYQLDKYHSEYPLRFRPCTSPGNIDIYSIVAIDTLHNNIIFKLDNNFSLSVDGTARPKDIASSNINATIKQSVVGVSVAPKHDSIWGKFFKSNTLKKHPHNLPVETNQRLKMSQSQEPLRITSSGKDPYLYLPPINGKIGFPVIIIIDIKFTAEDI